MRFKTFLIESSTYSLEQAMEHIRRECTAFLRASQGKPLMRGIAKERIKGSDIVRIDQSKVLFTDHPSNRPPRDSDDGFNFMFNAMMDVAFQEENIRRHSVFVTGSRSVAHMYGNVNFVFPAGTIKYLWSKQIDDSYESDHEIEEIMYSYLHDTEAVKSVKDVGTLFNKLATTTEPNKWVYDLDGKAEQLTKRALRTDDEYLYPEIIAALEKTAHELYINSKDLAGAIQKRAEILLYHSDGYFSVPVALVYDYMVKHKLPVESVYDIQGMYEFLLRMIDGKSISDRGARNET